MFTIISRFTQLLRSRRGTTAIEFALVAPVLLLFIMGILEVSLLMFTWSVLEGATNIGARTGKVGYPNGGDRTQFIRDEVEQLSGGYLDPAALNFTVTSFNDFSQFTYADHTDTANYEQCINPSTPPCPGKPGVNFVDSNGDGVWDQLGTPGTGNAGQTVLYKVTYAYPIFTPLMAQFFGNIFEISAIAAIKNEQFP